MSLRRGSHQPGNLPAAWLIFALPMLVAGCVAGAPSTPGAGSLDSPSETSARAPAGAVSSAATGSPAASSIPPTVSCHGSVTPQLCGRMASAALTAVGAAHGHATQVWVTDGLFCAADPSCLFDPAANFPYPAIPNGESWVGSVEVAFSGTDVHGGVLVASVGPRLVPSVVGFAVPKPGWCSGDCGGGPIRTPSN
jgi:hypothetical protein